MRRMNLVVAVAVLLAAAFARCSDPQPPADPLPGIWAVTGLEDKSPYSGVMLLAPNGDDYLVQSVTVTPSKDGPEHGHILGVGRRRGDVLAVAWKAGPHGGITTYELDKDGRTGSGSWRPIGSKETRVRTEQIRWIAPVPRVD